MAQKSRQWMSVSRISQPLQIISFAMSKLGQNAQRVKKKKGILSKICSPTFSFSYWRLVIEHLPKVLTSISRKRNQKFLLLFQEFSFDIVVSRSAFKESFNDMQSKLSYGGKALCSCFQIKPRMHNTHWSIRIKTCWRSGLIWRLKKI